MQRELAAGMKFVALKNNQFDERLEKCNELNDRLKHMSEEYRTYTKAQHNPAAADPTIRRRLNVISPSGAIPFVPPQPTGVYKDSDGDYVYKMPLENIQGAALALQEVDSTVRSNPIVAYAAILCGKALAQQHRATSSGRIASKPVPRKSVILISDNDAPPRNPAS
jgi:hypothetical protein